MSDVKPPTKLRPVLKRAMRLEYWNVFWTLTIVATMGLAMGQSQAMKTAWIEDMLGLVPPLAFLVAARLELKGRPSRWFQFGFERAGGLGFFVAAVALTAVGLQLLWDAGSTLAARERATVASMVVFGHEIWAGWPMLAAQVYAMIPPFLIARRELPLAEELNDKLLHTDALMNKANWMTGAAGCAGVIGLGLGWWWADAAAAAAISVSVIKDGIDSLRSSTAELIDGAPRALGDDSLCDEAEAVKALLREVFPAADVRLRETGRVIRAEVHGAIPPEPRAHPALYWPGDPDRAWRLAQVSFVPPRD